jgi:hypothetical protein
LTISFTCGALRLDPRLRVRLHGRNRLPELAITLTLATTMLFFGASLFAGDESGGGARAESGAFEMMEMRSAGPNVTPVPIRQHVRIIPLAAANG